MSLELYSLIAAVVSLGLVIRLVVRAHARQSPHFLLCGLSFLVGYALLLAVFLVDVVVASPLTPLLRFTRGFSAGLAVGLLLDSLPVAEVAFWSPNRFHYHALRERQLATIEHPEEELMPPKWHDLTKLG